MCLNIGTDPPDVVKTTPCARDECWIDPFAAPAPKSIETIGAKLQQQYERWQPRARYKQCLDPTVQVCLPLCPVPVSVTVPVPVPAPVSVPVSVPVPAPVPVPVCARGRVPSYLIRFHHITSHHITSHHITSHHITFQPPRTFASFAKASANTLAASACCFTTTATACRNPR